MVTIIIFIIIILIFLWLMIVGSLAPKIMRKQGRKVDVRVVSCEVQNVALQGAGINTFCYSIMVDFYGLNGETIVKTIWSEKSYTVGEMVRSIYVDKKNRLLFDEEKPIVKYSSGKSVTTVVMIAFLLIIIAVLIMECTDDADLKGILTYAICYMVGILFGGYGIYKIICSVQKNKDKSNIQVSMGTQVSYDKQSDRPDKVYIFYPIYEYIVDGEKYLYRSHIGGNAKKYKKIGRQVHMERNLVSGEIWCREDEKTAISLYAIMTAVGVFFFCLASFQTIQAVQANAKADESVQGKAYNVFITYNDDTMQKCAYSIDLEADGSGIMTLFPIVSVEGKSINQTIYFTLSKAEKKELFDYLESLPISSLRNTSADADDDQIIYIYEVQEEEQIGGYVPNEGDIYGDAYKKVLECIPGDTLKELNSREEAYYQ